MASVQCIAHALHTSKLLVVLHISKEILLGVAEAISDGIAIIRAKDCRWWAVDDVAVLDVEPPHLHKVAIICAVGGEELRHDLHGLGRIDRILRSTAVEVGVAHAVGVDVASILVTDAIISLALVVVTAIDALAPELACGEESTIRMIQDTKVWQNKLMDGWMDG